MPIDILWQPTTSSSNLFYCPSCNALLEQANRRAQYLVCGNCGSEIDVGLKSYEVITQHAPPKKYKPHSFIRIGQKAFINGKHYKVIARKCWKIRFKQYVEVDGPNYYEEGTGSFDEWTLKAEDNTYLTLMEDVKSYFYKEEIIPEIPMIMQGDLLLRFFENHYRQIVRKHGKAELTFFEGEKSKRVPSGQEKLLAFYEEDGTFGVECELDGKDKTIKNVNFYQIQEISLRELYDTFLPNEQKIKLIRRHREWLLIMALTVLGVIFFSRLVMQSDQSDQIGNIILPAIISALMITGITTSSGPDDWGKVLFFVLILILPLFKVVDGLFMMGIAGLWFVITLLLLSFFIFCLFTRKYKLIR